MQPGVSHALVSDHNLTWSHRRYTYTMASLPPEVLYGPAYPPPGDIVPDFENPPNENALGITAIVLILVPASICAILRGYSRIIVTKHVQFDDGLALVGYAFFITCVWSVIDTLQRVGLFVRQWNVRVIDFSHILYDLYILQFFYSFAMLLIKPAILNQWVGLFVPGKTRNWFYWIARILTGANILLYTAAIIVSNVACRPREKLWNFWVPGHCIDKRNLDLTTSSFNLAFDLCTLLLPQRIIWRLQMNMKRKIGISIMFSVGILACVAAGGRVVTTILTPYTGEATYGLSAVALWGLAELACVIMVYCIPAIPRIFAGSTLLSRIASSLRSWRSWTRLPRVSQASTKTSINANRQADSGPRKYPANALPNPYTWSGEHSQIQLTEITQTESGKHQTDENGSNVNGYNSGILKTTEVSTLEAEAEAGSNKPYLLQQSQHPWMVPDS
ncbi:hypothetical protein F5Y10DRAFT_244220 [Nemania abortiva]|nr:hypothetical protein F5Y10DRAFT_244220 [Nemania abortiva]